MELHLYKLNKAKKKKKNINWNFHSNTWSILKYEKKSKRKRPKNEMFFVHSVENKGKLTVGKLI